MLIASILPLGLFLFPLWKITLEAPQYPTPLGMYIHINDFSDVHPHDIKNINLMNHYVGMKYIPEAIPEFKIFPIGIISTSILGLLIAFKGNYKWFLGWFILMIVLSSAGLYDFYIWEHDYGHDLDPKAIMKFTNPDDGEPWNFDDQAKRKKAKKLVREQQPMLLIGSPMCRPLSILNKLNGKKMGETKWAAMISHGLTHLRFCSELYKIQIDGNMYSYTNIQHMPPAGKTQK